MYAIWELQAQLGSALEFNEKFEKNYYFLLLQLTTNCCNRYIKLEFQWRNFSAMLEVGPCTSGVYGIFNTIFFKSAQRSLFQIKTEVKFF